MTNPVSRRTLPVVLLLALAGCSFQGSVTAAGDSTGAHSDAPARPDSSPARSGSGTPAPTGTGTGPAATSSTAAPSGSATTPPAASGTAPSGTAVGRCHTAQLTGSLVVGSPGAGQRYATLVLENTGRATCTVHGYGGIQLVSATGAPLPTHQLRAASPAPTTVTLGPHAAVRSLLHWSIVPGAGDPTSGPCQPTPAVLQVIPPDETHHLTVTWNQGPVCEGGTIEQLAYTAG